MFFSRLVFQFNTQNIGQNSTSVYLFVFPFFNKNNVQKNFFDKILDKLIFMYYITIRQRGHKFHLIRCQASVGPRVFRLPPTFSLLWTLGPKHDSLGCTFLFLLSFLSVHPKKIPPNWRCFFYKNIKINFG